MRSLFAFIVVLLSLCGRCFAQTEVVYELLSLSPEEATRISLCVVKDKGPIIPVNRELFLLEKGHSIVPIINSLDDEVIEQCIVCSNNRIVIKKGSRIIELDNNSLTSSSCLFTLNNAVFRLFYSQDGRLFVVEKKDSSYVYRFDEKMTHLSLCFTTPEDVGAMYGIDADTFYFSRGRELILFKNGAFKRLLSFETKIQAIVLCPDGLIVSSAEQVFMVRNDSNLFPIFETGAVSVEYDEGFLYVVFYDGRICKIDYNNLIGILESVYEDAWA